MGAKWRKVFIILVIWLVVLSMVLRSVPPLFNTEIQPPTSGLLPYLQQDPMANLNDRGYNVQVKTEQVNVQEAGKSVVSAAMTLEVLNPSGSSVSEFTEDMTKLMHLIVVDRSLQFFAHVHPVYEGEGLFRTELTLPYGGDYLLITEFNPDDKGVTVHKQWMEATGEQPELVQEKQEETYTRTVEGVSFTLSVMPSFKELRAGQMAMLNFQYEDAETGEAIELEQFLGTDGHCVILDENAEEYVHVHAMEGMSAEGNVMFHAEFPKAGLYKLWGQFQYKGNVLTVPFMVEVK